MARTGQGLAPLVLHEDRYFDPDPSVRRVARELYEGTRAHPIVSPHGHVEAQLLADDAPFPEPTSLLVTPDHYLLRMLYSQGVALEALGVARRDAALPPADPRAAWRTFAAHYHLFLGTPSAAWLDFVLHELFGVRHRLSAESADAVYEQVAERLQSPEYRPRSLFERFGIEVLATTDAATDSLEHHQRLQESGWSGRVVPTFRPDRLVQLAAPHWTTDLAALAARSGGAISSFDDFRAALVEQRARFRRLGGTSTDHGVERPHTERLAWDDVSRLFERALDGEATAEDQRRFEAHMLVEFAEMSAADGLVMQLHAGALRDHNLSLASQYGANLGGDIPVATEYTRSLLALLNAYGAHPRFRLIVYTLDESTYARELAPLAGHYPAMRLGAPWWFHDSIEGMMRFRRQVTETAGIWNTAGFVDDTRAFCSIPARHDLSRRVDANWLAGLVARHVIDMDDAREMAQALAGDLARDAYRLGAGR